MVKPKEKSQPERLVRTTVRLPESLLNAAKHRAIDDNASLQEVFMRAVRSYLATGGRR
jgi:hypothetical protein